ncbi:MAG: isoprenylcysteine carboxylmethyltransferase family protein [Anaerolineae bacterium]|nr:isoprenylcysteine carboxylmethyltransferase family protein [Anaerolineae bacterium]
MIMYNAGLMLLAMAGFAVVHSLTAGSGMKQILRMTFSERFVEGWYRVVYNLFAVISFAPVLLLMVVLPDQILYLVPPPYLFLLLGIQGIGGIGFLWGASSVDLCRFAGVRQVYAFFSGGSLPLPEEALQARGVYKFSRHPLYFFSLVILWLIPIMSLNLLVFNVGVTLYLVIGSLFEERRLLRAYGKAYRRYQQEVPWLIPWPFPARRSK